MPCGVKLLGIDGVVRSKITAYNRKCGLKRRSIGIVRRAVVGMVDASAPPTPYSPTAPSTLRCSLEPAHRRKRWGVGVGAGTGAGTGVGFFMPFNKFVELNK